MHGNKMKKHAEIMAIVQSLRLQADALEQICRDELRGDRHQGYSEDDGGRPFGHRPFGRRFDQSLCGISSGLMFGDWA